MPEFNVGVSFQVWCAVCGEGLCFKTETLSEGEEREINGTNTYGAAALVKPCPKCMEKAREEGARLAAGLGLVKKNSKKKGD